MEFQFENFHAFLWMKGHGPYVWAAYGITFAGICGLGLRIRQMRKNFFKLQASIAKRQSAPAMASPAPGTSDHAS